MSDKNELQITDKQFALVEELTKTLTFYGEGTRYNSLNIAYVSDIHLCHHLENYENNSKKMIQDIVDKCYKSAVNADVVLFCGDISSSPWLTVAFFAQYKRRREYKRFKGFKTQLNRLKHEKMELMKNHPSTNARKYEKICKCIEHKKEEIKAKFDFSEFERYKERYYSSDLYEVAFEYYSKTKSFQKCGVSNQTREKIDAILYLYKIKRTYQYKIEEDKRQKEYQRLNIDQWENKYLKLLEDMTLSDYEPVILKQVYFVLGNHEYIEFENIESGVKFYKETLSKFGVTVLHNEYIEEDKYLIYGGTGFAKYEPVWNASRVVCCPGFSREEEIEETIRFEDGYNVALEYARKKGLCFICASHYPVSSSLNNVFDKETIYFTGHNHRNEYARTTNKVLYADNQIGYKNNNIAFKIATTGFEINPYYDLEDGLHKTSVEDYLQFYRYLGENIGTGTLLQQRCQSGDIYVIIRKGYYGFFYITTKKSSKGISIVTGGQTKKLTTSTELEWICENFEIVVSKYLQMLLPLRMAQEKLSKELRELGLDGTIHGLIVDIDFYHHIALNPVEGSMEFYYSSIWGKVIPLNSFSEVIQSLEYHQSNLSIRDYELLRKEYKKRVSDDNYLLGKISDDYLIGEESYEVERISQRVEQIVSRSDGIYGVSRKISPLQRLFTGRVLRDFDLRLTETKQHQAHRKKLYEGRVFKYEGVRYQIVEDEGGDIVVAEELQKGSRSKGKGIVLSGKRKKFAIEMLKAKIKNNNEGNTYWIE